MEFPLTIHDSTDKKVIIGLGSRQVSFLKINVYVMGMYVRPKDAKLLEKANLWTDTATAMSDIDQAQKMLGHPIDICIRIGKMPTLFDVCYIVALTKTSIQFQQDQLARNI
jgi:hypothetical protein